MSIMKLNGILKINMILYTQLMLNSHYHWTRQELIDRTKSLEEQANMLFEAPFAVAAYSTGLNPVCKYANKIALRLFDVAKDYIDASSLGIVNEIPEQRLGSELTRCIRRSNYIDNYKSLEVLMAAKSLFIQDALAWNVLDELGEHCGQAVTFSNWKLISHAA